MNALTSIVLVVWVGGVPGPGGGGATEPAPSFLRGDADGNGRIDFNDPFRTIRFLFLSRAPQDEVRCKSAGDANDDGRLDISDVIFQFQFQFRGGALPPAPFPQCGVDPTPDNLGCEQSPCPPTKSLPRKLKLKTFKQLGRDK